MEDTTCENGINIVGKIGINSFMTPRISGSSRSKGGAAAGAAWVPLGPGAAGSQTTVLAQGLGAALEVDWRSRCQSWTLRASPAKAMESPSDIVDTTPHPWASLPILGTFQPWLWNPNIVAVTACPPLEAHGPRALKQTSGS